MRCPGQDSRYWGSDAIFEVICPSCGKQVEFFKDEPTRLCKGCGTRVANPRIDFSCATYCQFAEQCIGDLPLELVAQRRDLLKDRVAVEMKRYYGYDFKHIGHATKVARYAERLAKGEGGDPAVALTAAYLHEIGTEGGESNEEQKPNVEVARAILSRLKAPPELIDEVCDIIAHLHQPRQQEWINFKVVHDADIIAKLESRQRNGTLKRGEADSFIESDLLTATGRRLARDLLLQEKNH